MRKLVFFGLLILLIACREDAPAVDETAVLPNPSTAAAVPTVAPTDLPVPAVEETAPTATAAPPTATPTPNDPTSLSSIIEQVEALSAQFESATPYQTGWFYRREASYELPQPGVTPATYRDLADNWEVEVWTEVSSDNTIARRILLVYDTEGGLWERSAIIDNNSVRVLPEQTVDGRIKTLDAPLLFQTPQHSLLAILREMEAASINDHTFTAWEENSRYHIQIETDYPSPIPAENNTTGQSLNGAKLHVVLDMNTGELLQQQHWTINGAGEETLHLDAIWLETAVVSELPPLAAQTLVDAQALLAQSGD